MVKYFILILIAFSSWALLTNCAKEDIPITENPTMTLHDFEVSALEHSTKPFGKVKTTFSDSLLDYGVKFFILEASIQNQVKIDSNTGEMSAISPANFDYEVIKEISGKILATSIFNRDTCSFKVNVTNALDFFEVPEQSFSIDENPKKGDIIGTIKVTSEIQPVTTKYYFSFLGKVATIDENTGVIKVDDPTLFDHEVNPTIDFQVDISNGTNNTRKTFTINVKDVKDYVPFQIRLNNGATPFELMNENPLNKDSLYGNIYQGGHIFYLDNSKKDCYVVNAVQQGGNTQWTRYKIWIDGLDTSFGAGSNNTQVILKALSGETVVSGYGAKRSGYTDWFIPSVAEMRAMHKNFYLKNSNLFGHYRFWTSNQASSSSAVEVKFYSNRMEVKGHSKDNKLQKLWIRKTN